MKKTILLLSLVFVVILTKAQTIVNGSLVSMTESVNNDLKFSNDTVSVSFEPSEHFWYVKINNNLKDDISIVWDKSTFVLNGRASKIIFDNTLNLYKDNPIPDQEIPSGSFIDKRIFPVDNLEFSTPTISKRFVKQRYEETGNPDTVKIVLAFMINDEVAKYDFNFNIIPEPKKK